MFEWGAAIKECLNGGAGMFKKEKAVSI